MILHIAVNMLAAYGGLKAVGSVSSILQSRRGPINQIRGVIMPHPGDEWIYLDDKGFNLGRFRVVRIGDSNSFELRINGHLFAKGLSVKRYRNAIEVAHAERATFKMLSAS